MRSEEEIKDKLREIWKQYKDPPALWVQTILSGISNPRKVWKEIMEEE